MSVTLTPHLPITDVVITRPQPQATHWMQMLQQRLPQRIHSMPCMAVSALPPDCQQHLVQAWQALHTYAAVFFVSPAAVTHFFSAVPHAIQRWQHAAHVRAWAPGAGTRQALLQLGVDASRIDSPTATDTAQFDSEHLWPLLQPHIAQARQRDLAVLRVRGTDATASELATACAAAGHGRDWLAQQLVQAGLFVQTAVAYQRYTPIWEDNTCQQAQKLIHPQAIWLWSSSQALQYAQQLLHHPFWPHTQALATHPRIAAVARQLGFAHITECLPTIDAVVQSIQCHA